MVEIHKPPVELQPAASRKERPFTGGVPTGSIRTLSRRSRSAPWTGGKRDKAVFG